MTVPDALVVTSQSFEIKDINTNEIIAYAKVNADNKSISLTYTDYVEKHNDTKGSFFFYARVDFKKHPQQGEIPIEITINKESKPAGKITFKGIGDGDPKVLTRLVGLMKVIKERSNTLFQSIVQKKTSKG